MFYQVVFIHFKLRGIMNSVARLSFFLGLFSLVLLVGSSSVRAAESCQIRYASKAQVAKYKSDVKKLSKELQKTEVSYREAQGLVDQANNFNDWLFNVKSPNRELVKIHKDFVETLSDFENMNDRVLVSKIIVRLLEQPAPNTASEAMKLILESYDSYMVPFFTEKQAHERMNEYLKGKESIQYALGEMTFGELQEHLYGSSKSIKRIAAGSLLGRFFAECKEFLRGDVSREILKFKAAPEGSDTSSYEKLFIALDANTFPIYQKYFNQPYFLTHAHQPAQGTLMMAYNGQTYGYGGSSHSGEVRLQSPGALWPTILLSSSEAHRVENYFDLGRDGRDFNAGSVTQHPWKLSNGREEESYCARGAYSSCTHWVGNIPLGDKLVKSYMFPGNIDEYADGDVTDKRPQVKKVGSYKYLDGNKLTKEEMNRIQLVWRQKAGHAQLWEVLGLRREQASAELANPGYVAYSLISGAKTERVPFVFVTTNNARQALPAVSTMAKQISAH